MMLVLWVQGVVNAAEKQRERAVAAAVAAKQQRIVLWRVLPPASTRTCTRGSCT